MSHNTSVEVSRTSQVHQIPQTGRAHSGPVTRTTVQKTTPTSAAATATASAFGLRRIRYTTEATKFTRKKMNIVQAEGTW